jgi:hypothetical protein
MRKNKIFGGIAVLAIAAVAAVNISVNAQKESPLSMFALANVEALADEGGTSYLKELEWIECPISEVVVGVPIKIGGITIPVGGSYTTYGTKKACTFWLFASCDQSQVTHCQKIN